MQLKSRELSRVLAKALQATKSSAHFKPKDSTLVFVLGASCHYAAKIEPGSPPTFERLAPEAVRHVVAMFSCFSFNSVLGFRCSFGNPEGSARASV